MKVVRKFVPVAALLLLELGNLQAQETLIATGGNASGSGGSVSYSVGQVAYITCTGTGGGSVAEGVQHPYEIYVVTSIAETDNISLEISVYPNPTKDHLTLQVHESDPANLHFLLYDMMGNLLQNGKITGNRTSIVMNKLVPATYFIKVIRGNKELRTFKIIKN